jgi:hypothetical protein
MQFLSTIMTGLGNLGSILCRGERYLASPRITHRLRHPLNLYALGTGVLPEYEAENIPASWLRLHSAALVLANSVCVCVRAYTWCCAHGISAFRTMTHYCLVSTFGIKFLSLAPVGQKVNWLVLGVREGRPALGLCTVMRGSLGEATS